MGKSNFVYVTYIATTVEKLWTALTDGKFTREYWGGRVVESDWNAGSPVLFRRGGKEPDIVRAKVLESRAPHYLAMSWTYEPKPGEAPQPSSRVIYNIEQAGPENVKLTVIHEEYEPGSVVDEGLHQGWSAILSSLKSFLETGQALAITKQWEKEGR